MRSNTENNSAGSLEIVIQHVRDAVAFMRRRGAKTEHAIVDVANMFELSQSRTKSLFYRDKMWGMACDEVARIEARFVAHLDREIALSVEYTEALLAKRNELKGREACKNAASQRDTSGSGSIGSRCGLAA